MHQTSPSLRCPPPPWSSQPTAVLTDSSPCRASRWGNEVSELLLFFLIPPGLLANSAMACSEHLQSAIAVAAVFESASPRFGALGEFSLRSSCFLCSRIEERCTKTSNPPTPARSKALRPWRHRRRHCSWPAPSFPLSPI